MKKIISFLLSIILLTFNQSCENDLNNCVFDEEINGLENALNTYIADASASNCYRLKSAAITLNNATKKCSEYTTAYDEQTLRSWEKLDCTDSGSGNNNPGGSGGTGGSGNNGQQKGKAVFYTNHINTKIVAGKTVYEPIYISVDGGANFRISGLLNSPPNCASQNSNWGSLHAQTRVLDPGTYSYFAYIFGERGVNKREWRGTFTVYANGCTKVLINNK